MEANQEPTPEWDATLEALDHKPGATPLHILAEIDSKYPPCHKSYAEMDEEAVRASKQYSKPKPGCKPKLIKGGKSDGNNK